MVLYNMFEKAVSEIEDHLPGQDIVLAVIILTCEVGEVKGDHVGNV